MLQDFTLISTLLLCIFMTVMIEKISAKIDLIECQHVNAWQIPESLIEDTQFPKPIKKPK